MDCQLAPQPDGAIRCTRCDRAAPRLEQRQMCGYDGRPRCICGQLLEPKRLDKGAGPWHLWCSACRRDWGLCQACNDSKPIQSSTTETRRHGGDE